MRGLNRYIERKAAGLCTRCGVELEAEAESVLCPSHQADNAAYQKRHRAKRRRPILTGLVVASVDHAL